MNRPKRPFEFIALGGAAFVLSGAVLSLILEKERTAIEGNPAWRLVLTVTYLGVALVLLPVYREALFVLRRNWPVVALLALAALSSFWAELPDLVLRKWIGVFGMTLFGTALAIRLSFEEQLRMLSWLFRILAALSLGCVLLFPSYGISSEGEWMGVFNHKNALGSAMGLALLIEWRLPADGRFSKVLKGLAILLYLVLLVNSDSITPAVALVGTVVLLKIYEFATLKLRVPLYAVLSLTTVLVSTALFFVVVNGDKFLGVLGRSSNLTGRTEIWILVISFIAQRPFLGFGYSGFWLGASPESSVVDRVMRGPIMYSHNGYLEMLLTLGMTGFVLMLFFVGSGMKRALALSKQPPYGLELWPLAFLLYFLLHNLGECTILVQDLEWAMCISCIAGADLRLLVCRDEEEAELSLVPAEELG